MTATYQTMPSRATKLSFEPVAMKDHSEDMDSELKSNEDNQSDKTIPSEELLLSIVRMGSMTSIPKTICVDHQDEDIFFPPTNMESLLERCHNHLKHLPKPLDRQFIRKSQGSTKDTI